MKLTNAVREALAREILRHRFTDEVERYMAERAQFANDVYCDIYRKTDRDRMEALPAGWLPEASTISAQFGESGSYYETLVFNGDVSGSIRKLAKDFNKPKEIVQKRVLYKHKHGCAKVYAADHKLSARYQALKAAGTVLRTRVDLAGKQADAALGTVTTMAALIKAWPEVEPFTKRYFTAPAKLPAIPVSTLNAMFKLPVKEAA